MESCEADSSTESIIVEGYEIPAAFQNMLMHHHPEVITEIARFYRSAEEYFAALELYQAAVRQNAWNRKIGKRLMAPALYDPEMDIIRTRVSPSRSKYLG